MTSHVLAKYKLCLLGNDSKLAMAALLLAISQFRFRQIYLDSFVLHGQVSLTEFFCFRAEPG